MQEYRELLENQAAFIRSRLNLKHYPQTGIVLGTGLGDWSNRLRDRDVVPFEEIPGFPVSTVQSHSGNLNYGKLDDIPLFVLQGRLHLYEGYQPGEICNGVRLLALLGVQNLILTNVSGAINPEFQEGSVMAISDQINMTGSSPLRGSNVDSWGVRFPDMSEVYNKNLLDLALDVGRELNIRLEKGVYIGVAGPNLETSAEIRAYKTMGGDAIGMSTVLEAIAAKHMGLKLLGLSCLTNKNLPDNMQETSFEQILEQAENTGKKLDSILTALIPFIQSKYSG